jgi:hypothetical protein
VMPGSVDNTRLTAGGWHSRIVAAETTAARPARSMGWQGSRRPCSFIHPDHSWIVRSGSGMIECRNRAMKALSGLPSLPGASTRVRQRLAGARIAAESAEIVPARPRRPPRRRRLIAALGLALPDGCLRRRAHGTGVRAARIAANGATPSAVRAVRAGPERNTRRAADDSSARVSPGVRWAIASSTDVPVVVTSLASAGLSTARRSRGSAGNRRRHSDRLTSTPKAT